MSALWWFVRHVLPWLAAAGALVGAGWYAHSRLADNALDRARAELADERLARANVQLRYAELAIEKNEEYRKREAFWREKADAADARLREEAADRARRLGELATRAASLQYELEVTARGRGAALDSVAECRRDAAALGDVSREMEHEGRAMAEAAEQWAGTTRWLVDRYQQLREEP
jgi:hypothetical protein